MFMSLQDTIQKFQQLPANVQQALSSDEAMGKIEAIEKKYNVKLASIVLRAAVREFPFEDLGIVIKKELGIKPEQAGILEDEILDQVFASVMTYYSQDERETPSSPPSPVKGEGVAIKPSPLVGEGAGEGGKQELRMPPKPPMAPPRPAVVPPKPSVSTRQVIDSLPVNELTSSRVQPNVKSQSVTPPPPQPPKARSYFYFDAEDEKELEQFKKHPAVGMGVSKDYLEEIDKAADRVIASSLVRLTDDTARRRLQSMLVTFFRDIRDSANTKELLARPAALAGMGFDAVIIERVMALAKEEYGKLHGGSQVKESEMPSQSSSLQAPAAYPAEVIAGKQEEQDESSGAPATVRRERPRALDTGRPKISEVKAPSRLVGPIEEIERTTLTDLRRFSQSHRQFIDRMIERLKLLEDESYDKRVAGISAWRKSPLFQQYLETIKTALDHNENIPQMVGSINETESGNMSLREWQTINRLNRELRV